MTNVGSDMASVTPMLDEIERRTQELPAVLLADANHASHDCIRDCTQRSVEATIAVPERSKSPGPNAADDEAVVAWRQRMKTERSKELYRARAGLCELPNAHLKSRLGLTHLLVRSLPKVTCVVLLAALAANLVTHASALLG